MPIDTGREDIKDNLKKSKLGALVMFLMKCPDETPANKRLAMELVHNWSRWVEGWVGGQMRYWLAFTGEWWELIAQEVGHGAGAEFELKVGCIWVGTPLFKGLFE